VKRNQKIKNITGNANNTTATSKEIIFDENVLEDFEMLLSTRGIKASKKRKTTLVALIALLSAVLSRNQFHDSYIISAINHAPDTNAKMRAILQRVIRQVMTKLKPNESTHPHEDTHPHGGIRDKLSLRSKYATKKINKRINKTFLSKIHLDMVLIKFVVKLTNLLYDAYSQS
jgi:hypothetical protein